MAVIKPFAAFHPAKGLESTIAALPYDVFNSEEARSEVALHPDSFLAIDRAETTMEEGTRFDDPAVYRKAHDLLAEKIAAGQFVQDDKPHYYIYAQTFRGRTQTGIVACASIDDYINGVIKKHENTREDKEMDRIRHVDTCNAQTGPIFLAYRNNDTISEIVSRNMEDEPICDFISEGDVRNRVYRIDDRNENVILEHLFAGIDSVYIADGHHRCASAVKVGLKRRKDAESNAEKPASFGHRSIQNDLFRQGIVESDYFLAVLFPENELEIMDYNRVVRTLNGNSPEELLSKIREAGFEVSAAGKDIVKPERKGEIGMFLDGYWYKLTVGDAIASDDPVAGLDVSVLQNHILHPIFGIDDPRVDPEIDFVGGIRGLDELERRCRLDGKAAFAMYPTSIGELFRVADAGLLMPPKSTWFEPKLLSGLFIHAL